MEKKTTITELLGNRRSNEPAIVALFPSAIVTYQTLTEQVEILAERLLGAGLNPGESVALVLPNGLEFLMIFIALVRAGLVAVPLNPADKAEELVFSFKTTAAQAVIAYDGNLAVKEAVSALGLRMWQPKLDPHGFLSLEGTPDCLPRSVNVPRPDDIALFASTSGTTGRAKIVPLTHANIAWSAVNIASHYHLTASDRSLLVLPLFHGHGLIGCAMSTLASGGMLVVPPRFSASEFWRLCREHRITWFTAVPTIHQILLTRADSDNAPSSGLRFIRSCSAPLSPATLAKLEMRFGAPVLEAYGMTEAAHQVASNPLPPLPHKSGSVGIGGEIAIIDDKGHHLRANCSGEVIVRGPNLMSGYYKDDAANAAAFIDGWFRTGDLGVLDEDGYLRLDGRIKELINRGGEKIAPSEVEGILLQHPAVVEAAVFGVPDAKYGEEIGAAVVLRSSCEARELQKFCRDRIADFKVPKFISFASTLPRNAMGKVQRREVAAQFGKS